MFSVEVYGPELARALNALALLHEARRLEAVEAVDELTPIAPMDGSFVSADMLTLLALIVWAMDLVRDVRDGDTALATALGLPSTALMPHHVYDRLNVLRSQLRARAREADDA